MSDTMKHMTQNSSWGTHLQLIILRRRVMNLSDLTGAGRDKSSAAEMERIQKISGFKVASHMKSLFDNS